jgi:hypothetical protein
MSLISIIPNYIQLVVIKDIIKIYLKDSDSRFKASGEANPAKIISNSKTKKYSNKQNKINTILLCSLAFKHLAC